MWDLRLPFSVGTSLLDKQDAHWNMYQGAPSAHQAVSSGEVSCGWAQHKLGSSSFMTLVSWPKIWMYVMHHHRNNRNWAPSLQHEQGRRFLPEQVMEASFKPWRDEREPSWRKHYLLHPDLTIPYCSLSGPSTTVFWAVSFTSYFHCQWSLYRQASPTFLLAHIYLYLSYVLLLHLGTLFSTTYLTLKAEALRSSEMLLLLLQDYTVSSLKTLTQWSKLLSSNTQISQTKQLIIPECGQLYVYCIVFTTLNKLRWEINSWFKIN